MAQDEYLGVLGEDLRTAAPDEPEQPAERVIEERQGHGPAWPSALELVKPRMGVIGPYRLSNEPRQPKRRSRREKDEHRHQNAQDELVKDFVGVLGRKRTPVVVGVCSAVVHRRELRSSKTTTVLMPS